MKTDTEYEQQLCELTYEINKYKKAIVDSGLDYYDFNLDTGTADESFVIGEKLGLQPEEYDTMEKRSTSFHPDDLSRNYDIIDRLVKGVINQFDIQSRLFCKDGSLLWLQHSGTLSIHPITGEKHLVGIMRDVTQEKNNTECLKYLADYDGLTGAYNRRSGLLKLEADVRSNEKVSIIYIDMDDFKYINDKYGHSIGDKALKNFSEKIKSFLPESAYLIRLGGDEFLCVIMNHYEKNIKEIIENMIMNPISYGNQREDRIKFSYGIVTYNENRHRGVDEFIHEADAQMYVFKNREKMKYASLETGAQEELHDKN